MKLTGIRSQIVAVIGLVLVVIKIIWGKDIPLTEEQINEIAGVIMSLYFLFIAEKLQRGVK